MKQKMCVLNSDSINKYQFKFTIGALEDGLNQSWLSGMPMHVSHDLHRLLGWTKPIGLYLEPGLTRLVGITLLPETEKERETLYKNQQMYLYKFFKKKCDPYLKNFKNELGAKLDEESKVTYNSCVSINKKDLARIIFDETFEKQDNEGLIPLKYILKHFEVLGPGVFKQKDSNLTLFSHPCFRRSLSRYNNFNKFFLDEIIKISNNELNISLAFDEDLVGYAPSYQQPMELEYWYGPKFDENIDNIPEEVTVYGAAEPQKLLHGISKTDFFWKKRNYERIFEIEEVKNVPSFGISIDKYGFRYVHSVINIEKENIEHLDGAIRIYEKAEIEKRLKNNIKKAGKDTEYIKLFKINGILRLSSWKSLISNFFQNNPMVIEYFKGEKEKKLEPRIIDTVEKKEEQIYCPYSLNEEDGIRLMLSYHLYKNNIKNNERKIIIKDFVSIDEKEHKVIEHDTIEVKKALERLDEELSLPSNIRLLACEDLYLNLPIIRHNKKNFPKNIKMTIEALKMIVRKLDEQDKDHVIAFTLAWPDDKKEVRLSVIGHVKNLNKWLEEFHNTIPPLNNGIGNWLNEVSNWLANMFPKSVDKPPLEEIFRSTGVLYIKRRIVPPNWVKDISFSDDRSLNIKLEIPEERENLLNLFKKKKIKIAPAFFLKESKCSACGNNYKICQHSKYLDSNITQILSKTDLAFVFWTDNKA